MHRDVRKLHAGNDEVAIGMLSLIAGFSAVCVKGKEDHRDFGSWKFNEDEKLMKMEIVVMELFKF